LALSDTKTIDAVFQGDEIIVSVPREEGMRWADSEQVSLEATLNNGEPEPLQVLIEKDFVCLKPRAGEDESELFPNPQAE